MLSLKRKNIITTRQEQDKGQLVELLESKGAFVQNLPLIKITHLKLEESLLSIYENLNAFNWIVFTSKYGVSSFFEHLEIVYPYGHPMRHIQFAVFGKRTRIELEKYGFEASIISTGRTTEDFIQTLKLGFFHQDSVLLVQGNLGHQALKLAIGDICRVQKIITYKNEKPELLDKNILTEIKNNDYDMIVLTSPSAFKNLLSFLEENNHSATQLKLACIGETTASIVRFYGLEPLIIAHQPCMSVLVEDIENYFEKL